MQQRYYDPVIGRFYSNDPVGFTASNPMMFNRYAYANNNPYKFTDPNGENPAMAISRSFSTGYSAGSRINSAITAGLGKSLGVAIYDALHNEGADNVSPENESSGNNNPYDGPVDKPVIVVDGDGNAIPVEEGEQIAASPKGDYQQVRDRDGKPTGTRMDKGGHKGQSDPKAQGPHGHRPNVTDESGNPHLPLNPKKDN